MPTAAPTSPSRCVRWARRASAFASALVALCPALLPAPAAADGAASPCAAGQKVVFHCVLGPKAATLCAQAQGEGEAARVTALAYRYGTPARAELAWAADAAAGRRFTATVQPLSPRASVRQLWFERGGFTYLLHQCVGGDCPAAAGLAVLKGERVLSARTCQRSADDRAWFAPELVRWAGDASATRSLTDLVAVDDIDLGTERLYPPRRR